MSNWRTTLAWVAGPDWPHPGDTVRVIATAYQLPMYYDLPGELEGKIGTVVRHSKDVDLEARDEIISVKFPGSLGRRHGICFISVDCWKQVLEVVR
jgi:hypothetical protein